MRGIAKNIVFNHQGSSSLELPCGFFYIIVQSSRIRNAIGQIRRLPPGIVERFCMTQKRHLSCMIEIRRIWMFTEFLLATVRCNPLPSHFYSGRKLGYLTAGFSSGIAEVLCRLLPLGERPAPGPFSVLILISNRRGIKFSFFIMCLSMNETLRRPRWMPNACVEASR